MNHSHLILKLTATVKKHTCPLKFFEILEDRDFWLQFNEATQIPFTSHFLHILINKFKGEGFFTHLTSTIICYEGMYGLSDASYFQ